MTPSKSVKPYTPHPTPHTLSPRKTFCRKPYLDIVVSSYSGII
ncbi:MAG: hypothetical protein PX481_22785 [Microcystis sp. M53603_WE2]|nr:MULTISPECIES: hypothetical protein [unclassified Microcystis]MCZ8364253.1 hypothetical protein [Microcystis sp. LE19-251.1A]MDJ0528304.1 hypothetical protein [Microcystis sp. M53600_WE12]MCZ8026534.1 hypothetical protein [Microcystis sp. LE19-10.1B]MDJ0541448.1 hypothetical protein [Microcystis sp. M53603_WE2]MDJ0605571.1 hypothetical protein [Microcystis sp. M53602_WE12]